MSLRTPFSQLVISSTVGCQPHPSDQHWRKMSLRILDPVPALPFNGPPEADALYEATGRAHPVSLSWSGEMSQDAA